MLLPRIIVLASVVLFCQSNHGLPQSDIIVQRSDDTLVITTETLANKILYNNCLSNNELRASSNHSASIILSGISQSCAHLGNAIGAKTSEEKAQGILSILGAVFNTAAQLTYQQEVATSTTPDKKNQELTKQLFDLTELLVQQAEQDDSCRTIQPLVASMQTLKKIIKQKGKKLALEAVLATQAQTEEYLSELFNVLQAYLEKNIPITISLLKEKVSHYINSINNGQGNIVITHDKPLPKTVKNAQTVNKVQMPIQTIVVTKQSDLIIADEVIAGMIDIVLETKISHDKHLSSKCITRCPPGCYNCTLCPRGISLQTKAPEHSTLHINNKMYDLLKIFREELQLSLCKNFAHQE